MVYKNHNGRNGRKNLKQYKESYNMDDLLVPLELTDKQEYKIWVINVNREMEEMSDDVERNQQIETMIQYLFENVLDELNK